MPMTPAIDLSHSGTSPLAWQSVVESLPEWNLDPVRHRRLVVVAPHPDDETLGVGGVVADAALIGMDVMVLSLTDGEAAFVEMDLGERRFSELVAAMSCLAAPNAVTIERCGLPDGALALHRDRIASVLADHIRPGDLLLAPLYCDGHPDHDAAGTVAVTVDQPDVEVWLYPIWAWHWHDPLSSVIAARGKRSAMTATAAAAKAIALERYESQISGDDPILPTHFRNRFDGPFEVLVCPR